MDKMICKTNGTPNKIMKSTIVDSYVGQRLLQIILQSN